MNYHIASPLPFIDVPNRDATSASTQRLMATFVPMFYGDRAIRAALERCAVADYVQHNPGVVDGRDAAIAALEHSLADPTLHLDVHRILVDGPFALIHLHAWKDGERGGSVMDLYRVEGDFIVEHWDVIQQIPVATANPHPFF